MKFFDFGAFKKSKIYHIFHVLFGAFDNTSRKDYWNTQIMTFHDSKRDWWNHMLNLQLF